MSREGFGLEQNEKGRSLLGRPWTPGQIVRVEKHQFWDGRMDGVKRDEESHEGYENGGI